MRIVIDIPESIIEHIKDGSFGARPDDRYLLAYAAMEGIRLPEKHGRLIDADKAIGDILTVPQQYEELADWCCQVIAGQPTIIEADKEGIDCIKYKVCCPMCDNKKCVRGTEKCEAEIWAKAKMEADK